MATASVTNSNFVNGTAADADQVDQNFADLVAFLNTSVLHLDGTKTMTALLNLYTADPTSSIHAVSKGWLDGPHLSCRSGVAQTYTTDVTQIVKFSTPESDVSSGYSTSTGNYTVPRAGVYSIAWACAMTADSAVVHSMEILAGGVSYLGPRMSPSAVVAGVTPRPCMSVTAKLTASQTISPRAAIATGTTKTLGEWFTVTWLHG